MLQSRCCGDLGHGSFQSCIFPSSSKLQSPQFPLRRSRVLLGFRLHRPTDQDDPKVYLGFKVRFVSRETALSTVKSSSILYKKKKVFDWEKKGRNVLPLILRSLDSGCDVEETLNSFGKDLTPQDQCVVLKSQKGWERVLRVFEYFCSQEDYVPNSYFYSVVLRALGLAQKWDKLRLCWIRMEEDGILPTIHHYGVLVNVYGKAGFVKESLLWIKHMRLRGLFPNAIILNTVVSVLRDAKEFDRADRFYKNWRIGRVEVDDLQLDSMAGPVSSKHFLSTELYKVGGRSPDSEIEGSQDDDHAVNRPLPTSCYNTLIDMYGKAGRPKDAADVFVEMLKYGVEPDTTTFNTMIFTSGNSGNLWEAEMLLSKMERNGPSPDTCTYNLFLSIYANVGDIDAALRCYRDIRKMGLLPDVVSHATILHILCKRNMVQEVEAVIKEMDEHRVAIGEDSVPFIVSMYVKAGLLNKANDFLERFEFCSSFSSKTRALVMDSFAEKGLWDEAENVFFRKRDSFKHKKAVWEYNVMLKAYGMAKLYNRALSLFREMKIQGTRPDECTYRSLIQMFAGADMVDRARQLLGEMQELGYDPQCLTFSSLVACYVRLSQLSDAVGVYQEMERAGVKPNEFVYGSLINGFAENGECEVAINYFHKMEESGISANKIVLTSLVKVYCKLGSLEGAKAIYERMNFMEGGLDVVASNAMIDLFAEFGLVSEAKFVFENLKKNCLADNYSFATMMHLYKMEQMNYEINNIIEEFKVYGIPWNNFSFNQAMDCYVTVGEFRKCVELFHDMVPQKLLPDNDTMKILILVMRKANVSTEAVKRLRSAHLKGNVPTESVMLLKSAYRKGNFSMETVMQLESAYQNGKPYAMEAIITFVSSVVGLDDVALRCCETFIKSNTTLESFAYNVAMRAYEKLGQVDKALNVHMKMLDKGLEPDVVTYINLAACYGKACMVGGLQGIFSLLECGEIEPVESLYMAVCDALIVARRHDLVSMVTGQMRSGFENNNLDDKRSDDEYEDDEYDNAYGEEYDDDAYGEEYDDDEYDDDEYDDNDE